MPRCLFFVLALVFMTTAPALAQDAAPGDDLNLPSWAAPPPSPTEDPKGDDWDKAPPDFPGGGGDPAPVPVDGGLSLLALAGAGYAAHRLRRRDGDGDGDEDAAT